MSAGGIAASYVSEAMISLIEPIVIPDLFSKYSELKPDFSFLGSVEEYAQYYTDLEGPSGTQAKFRRPAEIPRLGSLLPLRRKHSLNSYWRYFRLSIEKAKWEGRSERERELFFLLPLVINIPINAIKANNRSLTPKVNAFLFPFGSCVINMDVKVSAISVVDLVNLIPNLKRASIMRTADTGSTIGAGAFSKLCRDIVAQITLALFGNTRTVSPFDLHTFLFVRRMKSPNVLYDSYEPHKRAIAAAMTGQNFDNVLSLKDVEACLPAKLKTIRTREILMFHPKGSFFYASPEWQKPVSELSDEENVKLRRKADCMRKNYQSCLNVLFAVNRFLKICMPNIQVIVPKGRLDELKKSLSLAFLTDPSHIYFRHAYEKIAPIIGLDESLKELYRA